MVLTCPWNGAHTSYTAQEALWSSLVYRLLTYCPHSHKGTAHSDLLESKKQLVQDQAQLKDQPSFRPLMMQSASVLGLPCMVLLVENVAMSS